MKDFDVVITAFPGLRQRRRLALSCFLNSESCKAVEDAILNGHDPRASDVEILMETKVGAALFSPEGLKVQFKDYVETARKAFPQRDGSDFPTWRSMPFARR